MLKPINLAPLKNSLEDRPTAQRAVRYLGLQVTEDQFARICDVVRRGYNLPPDQLTWVYSRLRGKGAHPNKVRCYPPEYIPKMLDLIIDTCTKFYSG